MTNRRVAAIVVLVDDGVVVICGRTQHAARNKCIRLRVREAVSQFIQDGAPEFRHSWNDVQLVRHVLNVAKKRLFAHTKSQVRVSYQVLQTQVYCV